MNYNIAVIKGDGIGPEITDQAMMILDKIGEKFGHTFNYTEVLMGGCAIGCNRRTTSRRNSGSMQKKRQRITRSSRRTQMGYIARDTYAQKPDSSASAQHSVYTRICDLLFYIRRLQTPCPAKERHHRGRDWIS